jgi:hypothetical protein
MSVAAVVPAVETWAARNQRWLSQRVAFWRERFDRGNGVAASGPDGPPQPVADESFEPAARRVQRLFGLSVFESELLVVAAGVEIDAGLRSTIARAQSAAIDEPVRLAFSTALAMLPEPHWDAISPAGPLRYWSLVDVDTTPGLARAALRIDERVLHYLTGVAAADPQLAGTVRVADPPSAPIDGMSYQVARELASVHEPLIVLRSGTVDAAHRRAARRVAAAACVPSGLRPLWVDATALPLDAREMEDLARRTDREAALVAGAVIIVLDAERVHAGSAARFVASLRSPVLLVGTIAPHLLADLPTRRVRGFDIQADMASADTAGAPAVRRAVERALTQFHVDGPVLDQALAGIQGNEEQLNERVWDALRDAARGGLDALAQRIDSDTSFSDLIAPPLVMSQLRQIAAQLRHRPLVHDEWGFGQRYRRGLGVAALFAGESGTGKTLAAEAIANAARLDLYRIDLATVVNKYIGETEKNLARLFDAAERSGAVLLFDEAEALFGKRSEVKDSHDRYANIEVAYLLQRVETYRGLAILTTNMKAALDRAFVRRIRFIVQFPFPDEAAREQIWRLHLPARAPLGAVDYPALAKLQLSGGHIRTVVLNAAFGAAERGGPIEQSDLVTAARAEFAKLERTFSVAGGAA